MMKYGLLFLLLAGVAYAVTAHRVIAAGNAGRPVVVELFTSQGCSSCPPADRLLAELANDATIVPLSYHVDYWDYIGWKDPFGSAANTLRQRGYAASMKQRSVFTPQMIIGGTESAVGSDRATVTRAIARQRAQPSVPISVSYEAGRQRYVVNITGYASAAEDKPVRVMLADIAAKAQTEVRAGENSGRSLGDVNIVRDLSDLDAWQVHDKSYIIPTSGLQGDGIAVFLQEAGHGRIIGSVLYWKPLH